MRKTRTPRLAVIVTMLAALTLMLLPGAASAGAGRKPSAGAFPVARSWYFAEGTTAYGFEEYVCVQNPTPNVAKVQATYMMPPEKGQKLGDEFELPSLSRATINVAEVAPSTDVSVKVDSDQEVICERSMYWAGRAEGHDSIGVMSPQTKWYLAEGCTNYGFEEYLSLQNPLSSNSTATITYNTSSGPKARAPIVVPAHSRKTIKVNDDVPPDDVSVTVNATKPLVAERSMYWDARRGGHDSIGTSLPSLSWFMAEGSTKWGFDTFVLVQNPGTVDATVNMTYLTGSGPVPEAPPIVVKAGTRTTVDPRGVVGNADFSTKVTSSRGIICERSMYWNNGTGKAGHDTIGLPALAKNCFLAEGTTAYGFETFVLVANPNNEPNDVEVSYMTPEGEVQRPGIVIAPNSRVTIDVNADLPSSDVSIRLTADKPIAAERSMYWHGRGGGTDSIGYMTDKSF